MVAVRFSPICENVARIDSAHTSGIAGALAASLPESALRPIACFGDGDTFPACWLHAVVLELAQASTTATAIRSRTPDQAALS